MDVEDEVVFSPDELDQAVFRWHLGTQDEVKLAGSDRRCVVTWKDAEITLESSIPLVVTTAMLPDNTVNLGDKTGPDYLHRCVLVRMDQPSNVWKFKTSVVGR